MQKRASSRLSYVDWVRGLAILVMIQAHALDAWTRPEDRSTVAYGISMIVAGFGAPMFLFLAGVSVALAASGRERRLGDPALAAASIRRRGWEIFGLAFLFRLQAYLLNPGAKLAGLLKVDILNIMGPSIVAAAAAWQAGRRYAPRLALFAAATLAFTLLTPPVRAAGFIALVPDPLEWYLRPAPGRSTFTLFPWAGFVFAGGFVGVLIAGRAAGAGARSPSGERRFQSRLLAGSMLLAAASYAGSHLPSIYPNSNFWTTAPTYFLLRVGIVSALLPLAWLYEQRPRPLARWVPWSPMALFGQSSLFVYWVHTELAYGAISTPLHKSLPFARAAAAFALLTLFMFALTLVKNRAVGWWKDRKKAAPSP
ncbi:MAG: putative rane protein [Acidobacteria bacterium]|nr:putative rane protein [Acidobacteriota bacterium]